MKTTPPSIPTPDDAALWHAGQLYLADQRILPERAEFIAYDRAEEVADAIRAMVVRGAPAIGVTAAYGVALAGREAFAAAGAFGNTTLLKAAKYKLPSASRASA